MPQTTARKSTKAAPPTWSRLGGGNSPSSRSRSSGNKSLSRSSARKPTARAHPSKTQNPRSKIIEIPEHMRVDLAALMLLVAGALVIVGLMSWRSGGAGVVAMIGGFVAQLFGIAAWLLPVACAGGAVLLLFRSRIEPRWLSPVVPLGGGLMLLGSMGFVHLFTDGQPAADAGQGGGYLGLAISTFLSDYLTKVGAGVVLIALIVLGVMLAFGLTLVQVVRGVGKPTMTAGRYAGQAIRQASGEITRAVKERPVPARPRLLNGDEMSEGDGTASLRVLDLEDPPLPPTEPLAFPQNGDPHAMPTLIVNVLGGNGRTPAPRTAKPVQPKPDPVINVANPQPTTNTPQPEVVSPLGYIWKLPALNLLETTGQAKVSESDIKTKIKIIEETLHSFNVEATVREVNTGPAVTQFAIEPGVGVRVNRVTALDKDLALALAAPDIRIEAPIPGQSRIGIEVPNVSLQVVGLRSIMESDTFQGAKGRLKIALGRDTHGQPVVTDLTKLPHILVAGATGSGKSVFLNSMVIGFLLQFTPDDLRMLMIDPKRVELTGFNGIPHLLRPVVTDVRLEKDPHQGPKPKVQNERERPLTAVEALKWALWEMERRYKLFAKGHKGKDGINKVFRNIEQYRTFLKETPEGAMEHLPYIVIMIDELADLMLTAPEEVETSLCRLAQLARATGIHLVVATQRPSVDVVTGLIKANFPARAAFAVTSQVDSKVILDGGGAEKLLGRGDMLYTASDESKPVRIQGTFVSDAESDKIINFWRKQLPSVEELADNGIQAPVQPMPMPEWLGSGDANEESELLEQAIELVKRNQYVSVSMLQRKLRVGYNRAARLVEQMEELGLIAPAGDNRGKPREVLLGAPDSRADAPDEPEA